MTQNIKKLDEDLEEWNIVLCEICSNEYDILQGITCPHCNYNPDLY